MTQQDSIMLKSLIDQAAVVSFDVFDTLLFRKTNQPETVFELIGKRFGIHGFRKMRMSAQDEASVRAFAERKAPHANMDEIYQVLQEHTEISVDWMAVKAYEIQLEADALTANREMLEIFRYAKDQGKRVIAVSDMYLFAETLSGYLEENGFVGFDKVYCSADEGKAKFNRELFPWVLEQEGIAPDAMLHIGDKQRDDCDFPAEFGIHGFLYRCVADMEKVKPAPASDVDKGLYKILADDQKGFWYNLGVEVGGPLYLGLYRWLKQKTEGDPRKIFFLSRDGYNLCAAFKAMDLENVEYLYTSRRSMLLAVIDHMDEEAAKSLPPYTTGQTVGAILDYLCLNRDEIKDLDKLGYSGFDDVVDTHQKMEEFYKLYLYNADLVLERCRVERENALCYFDRIGLLREDAICFDCGWQGSSQYLLEQFKKVVGCEKEHFFYYAGIRNSDKSRQQLQGCSFEAYLFDFYKNYSSHLGGYKNIILYEMFFSAPQPSVFYYDEQGSVVLEPGEEAPEKQQMLDGILDFLRLGVPFAEKYPVECSPETSCGHLHRLILNPTAEEAMTIGDLPIDDGFSRSGTEALRLARPTWQALQEENLQELYWIKGIFTRPDLPEDLKAAFASYMGIQYPPQESEYHLEDERDLLSYRRWLNHAADVSTEQYEAALEFEPLFSVVIPVYNTVTEQLEECIQSVLAQTYPHYELILVDDHSSWPNVVPVLQKYESDPHVKVIYRAKNGHISEATNDGIRIAAGDYIVFMDCDDWIESNALYEFAKKLNEDPSLDFIYSDEDKVTEDGKIRHLPFFKPEWSPDLFLCMMYTNHLATYRTSLVKELGGLRTAYNGSQDYDFTLRFMEKSDHKRVGHVSKILYHWRERKESLAYATGAKNYASDAARYAKEDYLRRNGIAGHLEFISEMSQYRVVYDVVSEPLVSIVIPSKDHPEVLQQCIDSIRKVTKYRNYEIIVVDNGSSEENKAKIEVYLNRVGAQYLYDTQPFNFSQMCNTGAKAAKGDYLLFLNDDIEVFQPEWLQRMLGHAQQPHTGAVGAKLFYPRTTIIQHGGGVKQKADLAHNFMGKNDSASPGYFGWKRVDINCICVTGACLLVSTQKFNEAGRFDEAYPVAYNDVKLCYALNDLGYYNVLRNDVAAYHHESLSRGSDQIDSAKLLRLGGELTSLYCDFPQYKEVDPFLNKSLAQYDDNLQLLCTNRLEECDIDGYASADGACLDRITVTENVHIIGWSAVGGEADGSAVERYLVFRDPYGKCCRTKVEWTTRRDVVDHFQNEAYLNCGYDALIDRNDLNVDLFRYDVGIMTETPAGERFISWCGKTNLIKNPKPRLHAMNSHALENFVLHPAENVHWYVDECAHQDSFYRVRGFAFVKQPLHYLYRCSLVLVDPEGDALEYEVLPEERLDVAYSFPKEHFLYGKGFLCCVYDRTLKPNREYKLVIRLRHQFNAEDVRDIETLHTMRV